MGSRCLRGQATPKMTIKLETEEGGRPTTQFLQVASLMPRAVEGAGSEPVAVGGGRMTQ